MAWRLLFRFIAVQLVVLIIALIVAGARLQSIGAVVLAYLPLSIWMGRSFFGPLGRMLDRLSREPTQEATDAELDEEESAEWGDLEVALSRMRGALKKQSLELIREREELAAMMSAIPDAIVATDRDMRILLTNPSFDHLFGGSKTETRNLSDAFRQPEVLGIFKEALASGSRREGEVQIHFVDDPASRYFSVSAMPLKRESQEAHGVVGVLHEVTALKRAERVRIDFVANVSHELRTPLTAIKGYTDTLIEDVRARRYDALESYLDVVFRNTDRLMALVEDLLDLSSLESGVELNKSELKTAEITQRVLEQLESKRAQKSLRIGADYEQPTVFADARRVEQVLVNLIDNAIKYVPEGGQIRVSWTRSGDQTLLKISDNGPGIPPESVARLFERFYRVDKARSREVGGTGLGLAIVKHIMQRHGGSVAVKSELGKGSEFVCDFPISRA